MTRLVWDMDGTLLDSTHVVPEAFVATVRELGVDDVDHERVVAAYSLGVPEVMLEHLVGRPLSDAEVGLYYDRLLGSSVTAYAGVLETLRALRARGLPIVIFTGASTRAARTLLASAGITYDVLVGGDQVARPKPAPDGLLEAARRLAVDPADLVYIGDAPTDLRAARSAGARGAAATWGHLYRADEPADVHLLEPADALDLLAARGPHPDDRR
ncbi:HAD-IA family hydrolase [Actinotalea ferrariae]|uniref:HAD family hydrolase n=1 Tax=Actinotalea ferrariae TaxID=1386098 RepID=UPI001C8B3EF7|nr:HAD-IA family hydrolase [Actinotalea ferrariae]MBX9245081.1 HAD-IA family hydrolase [Actinotalea ferrariae]